MKMHHILEGLLLASALWPPAPDKAEAKKPLPQAAKVAVEEQPGPILPIVGPKEVQLGDKLVLQSDSTLDGIWDLDLPASRYQTFGNSLAIWPPRPGTYKVLYVTAKYDEATKKIVLTKYNHFVVVSGGTPSPPDPNPDPDPNPGADYFGLRDIVTNSAQILISGGERITESRAHASLYIITAARIRAGQLASVGDVQKAQVEANLKLREAMKPDRQVMWHNLFRAGGPVSNKLKELDGQGRLKTLDHVAQAWMAIASGLGAVK
jgi:hypothetical protein